MGMQGGSSMDGSSMDGSINARDEGLAASVGEYRH